jgi:hypothetical protein
MAVREEGNRQELDHAVLADDHFFDLAGEAAVRGVEQLYTARIVGR